MATAMTAKDFEIAAEEFRKQKGLYRSAGPPYVADLYSSIALLAEGVAKMEARLARLEALVKMHLPCPHEHISQSCAYGKDYWCEDCENDILKSEVPFERRIDF
jgi:hypothetical protein